MYLQRQYAFKLISADSPPLGSSFVILQIIQLTPQKLSAERKNVKPAPLPFRCEVFDVESTYLCSPSPNERCRIRRRQQGTNVSFQHQLWVSSGAEFVLPLVVEVVVGVVAAVVEEEEVVVAVVVVVLVLVLVLVLVVLVVVVVVVVEV